MVTQQQSPKQLVGHPGYPLVGNLPEFARDPIKFVTRLQQEYGDVAAFSLMGTKAVLISDPKEIERVLLETGKRYSNGKDDPSLAMQKILGNGLVTSEGDFWKRQRKLMAPPSTTNRSSNMPIRSSLIPRIPPIAGKRVMPALHPGISIRR